MSKTRWRICDRDRWCSRERSCFGLSLVGSYRGRRRFFSHGSGSSVLIDRLSRCAVSIGLLTWASFRLKHDAPTKAMQINSVLRGQKLLHIYYITRGLKVRL